METLRKVAKLIEDYKDNERFSKKSIEDIKQDNLAKFELMLMANGITLAGGKFSDIGAPPYTKIGYMVVGYFIKRYK